MNNNEVEKFIKYIRQIGKVTFFVGAGFSIYCGMLLGWQLSEELSKLFKLKSDEDFKGDAYNLVEVTEYIEDVYGRAELIKNIKKIFVRNNREKLTYHNLMLKIPQLKSVITTNYDENFEQSFEEYGEKILNDSQLSSISTEKIPIFKIHGDFTQPNDIILTKKDYSKFYSNDEYVKPFWSKITTILSENPVVYIGYSLKDENIKKIIEKRTEMMGDNIHKCFIVCPDEPEQEQMNWLKKHNIIFIQARGEEFIKKVSETTLLRVYRDFKDNKLNERLLERVLKVKKIEYKITNESGVKELKLLAPHNIALFADNENLKKIMNLISGREKDIEVICTGKIISSEIEVANFNESSLISLRRQPDYFSDKVEIYVKNFEENIIDLRMDIYNTEYLREISLKNNNFKIIIKFPFEDNKNNNLKGEFAYNIIYTKNIRVNIKNFKMIKIILENGAFVINDEKGKETEIPIVTVKNKRITQAELKKINEILEELEFIKNIKDKFEVEIPLGKLTKEENEMYKFLKLLLSNKEFPYDLNIKFSVDKKRLNGIKREEIYNKEKEVNFFVYQDFEKEIFQKKFIFTKEITFSKKVSDEEFKTGKIEVNTKGMIKYSVKKD